MASSTLRASRCRRSPNGRDRSDRGGQKDWGGSGTRPLPPFFSDPERCWNSNKIKGARRPLLFRTVSWLYGSKRWNNASAFSGNPAKKPAVTIMRQAALPCRFPKERAGGAAGSGPAWRRGAIAFRTDRETPSGCPENAPYLSLGVFRHKGKHPCRGEGEIGGISGDFGVLGGQRFVCGYGTDISCPKTTRANPLFCSFQQAATGQPQRRRPNSQKRLPVFSLALTPSVNSFTLLLCSSITFKRRSRSERRSILSASRAPIRRFISSIFSSRISTSRNSPRVASPLPIVVFQQAATAAQLLQDHR